MKSIKCPQCGLTNWAEAAVCKRCGFEIGATENNFSQTDAGYQPTWNVPQPNFQPNYQPQLKTGLALASMIIGCAGFVLCWGLFGAGSLTGLILGIVALVKIKKKPFEYGGQGYAIAGVVANGVLLLFIPIVAAIAIPNLLAARRAANEASAISTLRRLTAAETTFASTSGDGKCGDIPSLVLAKLADNALLGGQKSGYKYRISPSLKTAEDCEITAVPIDKMSGTRSFYISTEEGVIRAAAKNGLPADSTDLPLSEYSREY